MKDFFKNVLATIVGIMLLGFVFVFFGLFSIIGMVASSKGTATAKENSVLVLPLKGYIMERDEGITSVQDMYYEMNGNNVENVELGDIVKAIRAAKDNDKIKGIYIDAGEAAFDSYATAATIRRELADFKKSGKWVMAYADDYTQSVYYVASVADSIFLSNEGGVDISGLSSQSLYYKGVYDKVGINYYALRVGKYKSAVEPLTSSSMSESAREQNMACITTVWNGMVNDMAASRNTTPEALNHVADDSLAILATTQDYMKTHLIDGVCYRDEMVQKVKNRLGIADDKRINHIAVTDMASLAHTEDGSSDNKIAVYYASGEIFDAEAKGMFGGGGMVGNKVARDLQKLAKDDEVKAVVLRVNSPGGSAVASDLIAHAVEQLRAKKPVVVSMGGVAASGGYMMSAPANYIMAEPYTITGSIGIFAIIQNSRGLWTDKVGLTYDGVKTNRNGDAYLRLSLGKDNADLLAYFQTYVNRGYDDFLSAVSKGRKLSREAVHEVAQGRVWMASDALKCKLVDELGTLDDAIKKAATLAKVTDYSVTRTPQKSDLLDRLMKQFEPSSPFEEQLQLMLGAFYEPVMEMQLDARRNRLQARLPYRTTFK